MGTEERSRTEMVLGSEAMEKLARARVAVFGIGGVGGYVCEALARAGVGALDLFDADSVSRSNLNRQIVALQSTVGREKVEVMRERIADINPQCAVRTYPIFYLPENADLYPLDHYSYVADAIDTVSAKVELVVRARAAGVPIISSMGTGNKLDPTRFCVTDLAKTSGCPLARAMRRLLRTRGIEHLKVVFSDEQPITPMVGPAEQEAGKRAIPGSVSFVPSVAGLILAGEIIKDLIQ
ncbi:MAG: tRNA threonylcarbamoyladenosine dehydratase [Ruminococcaceae bacterium]|nr:tRNA threonylcarbamoyladenosine dehydratase [Oscillospiraceae bacterium]